MSLPRESLVAHVSASFENAATARSIMARLRAADFTITSDWTLHNVAEHDLARARMADGLRGADVLVLIAPAGRSSHVEMGLAIAYGKPVVVYAGSPAELTNKNDGRRCAFYQHIAVRITHDIYALPEVARSLVAKARGRG